MNLAEQERDGGVSPVTSPFLTVTQLGNIFAKCNFNLPTIDVQKAQLEFTSTFSLLKFLSLMGEQGCLTEKRKGVRSVDSLVACAALFETLFNKRTIGERDEETATSILIDTLKDDFLFDIDALDINQMKSTNDYLSKKFSETTEITEKQKN